MQPEQAHQSREPPQPKDTSQVENKDALDQLVGKACQEVQYKGGLEVMLEDLVPLENDHVTLLVNVPRKKVQNHIGAKEEVNQSIKGLVPVPLLVRPVPVKGKTHRQEDQGVGDESMQQISQFRLKLPNGWMAFPNLVSLRLPNKFHE